MDVCTDEDVGFESGKLKTGVAAGEEKEEGVEACSVANRSGVGEGALGRLHAGSKIRKETAQKSLNLFIIQFNRFQIEFFTR